MTSSPASERIVGRLTKTMLALWLVVAAAFVFQGNWGALGVLTLTVVAAIVQLRWLASQVKGLVSLTLQPEAPPEVDVYAKPPADTQDLGRGPRELDREPLPGPVDPDSADQDSADQRPVQDESCGVEVSLAEDASGQFDEKAAIDSVEKQHTPVPRTTAIVVLRPVVLLGGLLAVFAIGSSEPLALTAGALTLPIALMAEALRATVKNNAGTD